MSDEKLPIPTVRDFSGTPESILLDALERIERRAENAMTSLKNGSATSGTTALKHIVDEAKDSVRWYRDAVERDDLTTLATPQLLDKLQSVVDDHMSGLPGAPDSRGPARRVPDVHVRVAVGRQDGHR